MVWTTPHRRRTGTLAMETNPTVAERELAKLDEVRATTKPHMTVSAITPDHPIPAGPRARATRPIERRNREIGSACRVGPISAARTPRDPAAARLRWAARDVRAAARHVRWCNRDRRTVVRWRTAAPPACGPAVRVVVAHLLAPCAPSGIGRRTASGPAGGSPQSTVTVTMGRERVTVPTPRPTGRAPGVLLAGGRRSLTQRHVNCPITPLHPKADVRPPAKGAVDGLQVVLGVLLRPSTESSCRSPVSRADQGLVSRWIVARSASPRR